MGNKGAYVILGILITVFIFMRVIVIGKDYLYSSINHETAYMACLAKDFSSGLIMSPMDYLYLSRQQGHLLAAAFASPFYYALGDSHLTLKIVSFVWSFLTFLVWLWCIVRVFDDRRAAVIFALLYIFLPPGSLRYSLELTGHWPQMEVLFPLTIVALLACLKAPPLPSGRTLVPFAVLGGLCGFGIYIHIYFVVMVATVLCCLLFLRPGFFRGKEIIVFIFTGLLAFSPRIYYQCAHMYLGPPGPVVGRGYNLIPPDIFSPPQIVAALRRCGDIFCLGVPLAQNYWRDYDTGFVERIMPWAYWAVCVFSYVYLFLALCSAIARTSGQEIALRRGEIYNKAIPLAPPIFFMSLAFTGISRTLPLQHFQMMAFGSYFLLIAALAISGMIAHGRIMKIVGSLLLFFMLLSACAGEWRFFSSERTGLGQRQRGTYYPVLAWKLKYKIFNLGQDADDSLSAVLAKRDPFDRRVLSVTLGDMPWSCLVCPEVGNFSDILKRAQTIRSPFSHYFWRGLGRVWIYSGRPPDALAQLSGAALNPHELADAFRGAGAMSIFLREPFIADYRDKIEVPEPHAHIREVADMSRFQGWRPATSAEDEVLAKSIIESLRKDILEEYRTDFARGVLDYLSWKHGTVSGECSRFLLPPGENYSPEPYFFPPMLECYL